MQKFLCLAVLGLMATGVLSSADSGESSMESSSSMMDSMHSMKESSSKQMSSSSKDHTDIESSSSKMDMAKESSSSKADMDMKSSSSAMATTQDTDSSSAVASVGDNGQAIITPEGVSLVVPSPVIGGQEFNVNLGTVPADSGVAAKLVLLIPRGNGVEDEFLLYGPGAFPAGPTSVKMPMLTKVATGCYLKLETIGSDGLPQNNGCSACKTPTFDLGLGGLAADPAAVAAAQAGPPAPDANGNADPDVVTFFFRIQADSGATLSAEDRAQAINSIDAETISPAAAFEVLSTLGAVLNPDAGVPSRAEANKIAALIRAALRPSSNGNGPPIARVLSNVESAALLDTLSKFMESFGLRSLNKKFQLQGPAEDAANVIQIVLGQLRQVGAQTAAGAGALNIANMCSEVVALATGGTFCTAGAFPHVVELVGANLPLNTHRVTAVNLNLAQMASADQTLTTAQTMTTAVSPHYAAIANAFVPGPDAHTLTSTFDSTKGQDYVAAADTDFTCFQRIATANGDPSGSYTELPAAQQTRNAGNTNIKCQGENSSGLRWVTLAKSNTAPTNPTVGSTNTISAPPTPTTTAAAARAVAASSDDDGSSASGIIGGVFGGVGCLLIVLAIAAFFLFKSKKATTTTGYAEQQDTYWQGNGAYKVPAPTPVM